MTHFWLQATNKCVSCNHMCDIMHVLRSGRSSTVVWPDSKLTDWLHHQLVDMSHPNLRVRFTIWRYSLLLLRHPKIPTTNATAHWHGLTHEWSTGWKRWKTKKICSSERHFSGDTENSCGECERYVSNGAHERCEDHCREEGHSEWGPVSDVVMIIIWWRRQRRCEANDTMWLRTYRT